MAATTSCLQLEEFTKMRTKSGLFGVRFHNNRIFKALSKDYHIFNKLRIDAKMFNAEFFVLGSTIGGYPLYARSRNSGHSRFTIKRA